MVSRRAAVIQIRSKNKTLIADFLYVLVGGFFTQRTVSGFDQRTSIIPHLQR